MSLPASLSQLLELGINLQHVIVGAAILGVMTAPPTLVTFVTVALAIAGAISCEVSGLVAFSACAGPTVLLKVAEAAAFVTFPRI